VNADTVIPLFASISKRQHKQLASLADAIVVPAGTRLTTQGGDAREFFIVIEGSADVLRDGRHIGTLWPSDFFGELGMLSSNWVRSETVVTASPMRLLVLGRREFQTLMSEFPTVAQHIREIASKRRATPHAFPQLRTAPTSLQPTALAPSHQEPTPSLVERARRLVRRPAGRPHTVTR
jgi:CRP-like cAMP-binding protein